MVTAVSEEQLSPLDVELDDEGDFFELSSAASSLSLSHSLSLELTTSVVSDLASSSLAPPSSASSSISERHAPSRARVVRGVRVWSTSGCELMLFSRALEEDETLLELPRVDMRRDFVFDFESFGCNDDVDARRLFERLLRAVETLAAHFDVELVPLREDKEWCRSPKEGLDDFDFGFDADALEVDWKLSYCSHKSSPNISMKDSFEKREQNATSFLVNDIFTFGASSSCSITEESLGLDGEQAPPSTLLSNLRADFLLDCAREDGVVFDVAGPLDALLSLADLEDEDFV